MIGVWLSLIYIIILSYFAFNAAKNRRKMGRLFDKTSALVIAAENLCNYYTSYFDYEKYKKERQGRGHTLLYDRRMMLEDAYRDARKALYAEYLDQTGKEIKRQEEPPDAIV